MHIGHGAHEHDGAPEAFETKEQAIAVMTFMLEHNRHHAEELHELSHRLEAMGEEMASVQIDAALDSFMLGNERLESALKSLKAGD